MDVTSTKMLSIHIDALLPPTSAELDLPHSAQVAAILGVGLVYQGTAQRRMAEVLLSEIGEALISWVLREIHMKLRSRIWLFARRGCKLH